jgi:hypothetical protein
MQVFQVLSAGNQTKLQAAFGRFGDTGSPSHTALCTSAIAQDAPNYVPTYMIEHGAAAFGGVATDGPVPGFGAASAWDHLPTSYLQCQPR